MKTTGILAFSPANSGRWGGIGLPADKLHPGEVTHQLGQALPQAGWPAWLAALAAVRLTAALLNPRSIPPMDGYRLTAETVLSLRGGKTLSPRVEGIMLFYGAARILLTGLYLAF